MVLEYHQPPRACIYFNNDWNAYAVADARDFRRYPGVVAPQRGPA